MTTPNVEPTTANPPEVTPAVVNPQQPSVWTPVVIAQFVAALAILFVMFIVALSPGLTYAPTPRIVLFFLAAVFAAILVGASATTTLKLEWPGFSLVTAGSAAVLFGILYALAHFSKPDVQIAVYSVVNEQGDPVDLNWSGAVQFPLSKSGIQASHFVKGNQLVLIFPEQITDQPIEVKTSSSAKPYRGSVTYAGAVQMELRLGTHLKK